MQPRSTLVLASALALCCVIPVQAGAQSPTCEVKRQPFANGGTSTGTMAAEQGSVCRFRFRFQQISPPDSWQLVEAPKSGTVVFHEDTAEYRPNAGFAGEDRFVVGLFGRVPNCSHQCNRNGRYEFTVSVKPGP